MVNPAEIRIQAEPSPQGDSCRFMLDQPLYEGIVASFLDKKSAEGSPLAEMLFALPNVQRVVLTPSMVTVYRGCTEPGEDWRPLAKQVGQAIRDHAGSGKPAVSDKVKGNPEVDAKIKGRVQDVLDREINPAVGMHGGVIRLLDVKNYHVYVQLGGGCQGCGMADVTLKQGIESLLKERIPEIVGVVDQTDHAGGSNPFYRPGKGG